MITPIRTKIKELLMEAGLYEHRIFLYPVPGNDLVASGLASAFIHFASEQSSWYNQQYEDRLAMYSNVQRWTIIISAPTQMMDETIEKIKITLDGRDYEILEDLNDPNSFEQSEVQILYNSFQQSINVEGAIDNQKGIITLVVKNLTTGDY